MLSKADLTTNMVYEFTNLQVVMGGYYAAYRDENPFIIGAIKEQYLPNAKFISKNSIFKFSGDIKQT